MPKVKTSSFANDVSSTLKKHVLFIFLSKNSNIHSRLKEGAKREYNYGNQSSLND